MGERAILDNEKQNLSNLELKVEKLSNIFESAVEIQDEDSYVECYSPERKKTYLELSSVQKQVIDLETKFEDYNNEIVSNKSRYDNILNSISKLEVRMDKISKKVQRISNNSHNVLLDSDVN